MDDNEIQQRLQQAVENAEQDIDWAWDKYREELEEVKSRASDALSEDQIQEHAIRCVRSDVVQGSRSTGGNVEAVDIVAIGHSGVQRWSDGDGGKKDVLIAHGIVQPEDKPRKQGVFLIDETNGADPQSLKSKFTTGAALSGYFSVDESDSMANVYRLNWRDESKLEEVPEAEQPSDEDVQQMIRTYVTDEAQINNIANHLSLTNENGYTVEFGADMKRINGTIVDYYDGENAKNYTILDDSVVDPESLGDNVVSENARTPGLTAWVNEEEFQYGVNSQCEFIGPISTDQNGQIVMNVVGIIPLIPFELDEGDDSANGGAPDDSVTTTEI